MNLENLVKKFLTILRDFSQGPKRPEMYKGSVWNEILLYADRKVLNSLEEDDPFWKYALETYYDKREDLLKSLRTDRVPLKFQYLKLSDCVKKGSLTPIEGLALLDLPIKELPEARRDLIMRRFGKGFSRAFRENAFPENYLEYSFGSDLNSFLRETHLGEFPMLYDDLFKDLGNKEVIYHLFNHGNRYNIKILLHFVEKRGMTFRRESLTRALERSFTYGTGDWQIVDALLKGKPLQDDPLWETFFYPLLEKEGAQKNLFPFTAIYRYLGPQEANLGRKSPYYPLILRLINISQHLDYEAQIKLLVDIDNEESLLEILKVIPLVWEDQEPSKGKTISGDYLLDLVVSKGALRIWNLLATNYLSEERTLKSKKELFKVLGRDLIRDPEERGQHQKYRIVLKRPEDLIDLFEETKGSLDFGKIYLLVLNYSSLRLRDRKNPILNPWRELAVQKATEKKDQETLEIIERSY